MLMRDLNAKAVLTDISAWIKNTNAPLPSGADKTKGAQHWAQGPCPTQSEVTMARVMASAAC
jgi:hypothetical protein